MAHFAKLNETNKVTDIVVIVNSVITDNKGIEQEQLGVDFMTQLYGEGSYKQTSYSGSIRKNYALIGYEYDVTRDAFIPPKPYNSWLLNEDSCQWNAPTAMPDDGKRYIWNEDTKTWDLIDDGWEE